MKKIAVFHFNPVEVFLPVMNLVNYLADQGKDKVSVKVFTSHCDKNIPTYSYKGKGNVQVYRMGSNRPGNAKVSRYLNYLLHYAGSFLTVCLWRPGTLLYIETLSSLVPYIIIKKLKRKVDLYIHYHEYMSPEDYNRTSLLNRIHEKEKKLYPLSNWISHTNEERMALFLKDIGNPVGLPVHIIPNFPPSSWRSEKFVDISTQTAPLRFIYTGAVDLESMYIKEFAGWIEAQGGKYTWDIYSHQQTDELVAYLASIKSQYIHLKGFINYFDLPGILAGYHIGLILYKGYSLNFVHNAPNKLFEYLSCDLDVWFPPSLFGTMPYARNDVYPKVIAVNFTELQAVNAAALYERKQLSYQPTNYFCESAFVAMVNALSGAPDKTNN